MKYNTKAQEFDLKGWRKAHRVSTRALSKIVGGDYSYLYRLERGVYTANYEYAKKVFKKLEEWEMKNKLPQFNFPKI